MSRQRTLVALLATVAALCLGFASPALGAQAWRIDSLANSTVAPGGTLDYFVKLVNVGDQPMDGSQITVTATLPSGMTLVSATLLDEETNARHTCSGTTSVVCTTTSTVPVGEFEALNLTVRSSATSGTLTTRYNVTGGGAPSLTTADPTLASSTPPAFGIDALDGRVVDATGQPDTQAGGHPYEAGVSIDFNTLTNPIPILGELWPVEAVKDVHTDLPPGLVGNPTAVAQCTLPELSHSVAPSGFAGLPLCPPESQVGTTLVRVKGAQGGSTGDVIGPLPVYNLVPAPGVPAQFGFNVAGSVVVLDGTVRPNDYGISVNANNVPEALAIIGTDVTLWGNPADPSHDAERACPGVFPPSTGGPTCVSHLSNPQPFLRGPTECTTPDRLTTSVQVDSWQNPGAFTPPVSFEPHDPPGYPWPRQDWGRPVGTTGCDRVPFDPTLSGAPDPGAQAGTPSGFSFDLSLPQPQDLNSLGESDLKKAVVTLPVGVRVSPSSANGLDACSSEQIALGSESAPRCPKASKLGSVVIDTPLLNQQVTGSIYLATPFDNPFNSLVAIYLVASADGVVLKIPGQSTMDPTTGQITATFDNNPQLPFTRLHLEFKGGPRAPLTLPSQCGTYTTNAVLTGWNGDVVRETSSFSVTQDENGQPCPPQFTPSFDAGTDNNTAGSSASFLLRFARQDGDQDVSRLTVNLPDGLTGKIAAAALCPDAQAAAGTCSSDSKIGDVTVGSGQGIDPFYITTGQAFLTGPYNGAPFGVSIVVPAVAGPFNLGDVVVRSALFVDRNTADVTIVSDPLPTILQGIPLDVRDVRVSVDKPGFFQNPTSCADKTISGVLTSTAGASANVSQHYQAADCAKLGFKPSFRVSTSGRTSRSKGASLIVNVGMRPGGANIAKVRVRLPRELPSRVSTLNLACVDSVFESNPAACPEGSRVGTAIAVTPILRSPLTGPAYIVSHGGAAFPDLEIVLQGEGIEIVLDGKTDIKNGVTTSSFNTVPDEPVSSFRLSLPQGPHSILGAPGGRLCKAKLLMPTTITGQNGAVVEQNTRIAVTGCAKKHPKHKGKGKHKR